MAIYNQVSYGSGDKATVTDLQKKLNEKGANLTVDGIFGNQTKQAVMDYQKQNGLVVDGIVGNETWGSLTKVDTPAAPTNTPVQTEKAPTFDYKPYTPSDTVTQAEALLQQQLANKPGSYTSPWQTQLNDIIQKIQNREDFSYDLNGDALYQQYKDQYTTQGKMAMMDTMGQAQAMTGGYGNSYAQAVGQQAYQRHLQGLNDKIPELYQLALNQYNREGDELYDQASLLAGMEAQDYGRYRDQVSDYYTELDRLTNDSRYQAEQDYSKWADDQSFGYQQYRDQVADKQWQAQFDEAKRQYDEQMALSQNKSSGGSGGYTGYIDNTSYGDDPTGYDNGGLSEAGVRILQNALGVKPDGKWGPETQAAAKAKWGVTSAMDAYQKYTGGKDADGNGWEDSKEVDRPPADYKSYDGDDWEHFFALTRQTFGKAEAERLLSVYTSAGYIPTNMVSLAAVGARGGSMGH